MYLLKVQNSSSIRTHCGRTCKQPALTKSTMKLQTYWLHPKKPMTGFKQRSGICSILTNNPSWVNPMIQSFSPWTTERHVGYVTECFHKGCRSNDSYIPKIEVCHWISRCLLRRILRQTRKAEQQLATTTESLTHSLKETASTSAVHFHLWLISILYMKKHRIPLFVLLLCTILFFVLAST